MEHPHDYKTKEELDEWVGWQAYTLLAGLACGLLANLLVRHYQVASVSGDRPPGGSMGNRGSSAAAAAASKVASLGAVSASNKMVLVVRTDIGMGKGKACAQCSHAAVECYRKGLSAAPQLVRQWERFGQKKVALKAGGGGEEELEELRAAAEAAGMCTALIRDAGSTQLDEGTATVLGVGPAPESVVDQVTGHLKLY